MSPAASSAPAAAAPGAPSSLPVTSAVALVGEREVPLTPGSETSIDPASAFRIEIGASLVDARLALHDEEDAMVASEGTMVMGASSTRLGLTPHAPLRPGASYVLKIDGAATRNAHDSSGRAYGPLEIALRTTGQRPPPPSKKSAGRRR